MTRRKRPLVLIHASSQQAAVIHEALVGKGFSVLEAPAQDFLDVFSEFRPDLVMLEHSDDSRTTKDLARRLRDTDLGQVVPVILFGKPPGPNPVDIVSMGADQFVTLPIEGAWLDEKLKRLQGEDSEGLDESAGTSEAEKAVRKGDAPSQDDWKHPPQAGTEQAGAAESKGPGTDDQGPSPAPGTDQASAVDITGGLGLFDKDSEDDTSSVLGAISDVLAPGDLPADQDIDLDALDVETTIPGIVPGSSAVPEDQTGESDLDIAEDTDQEEDWQDSRTGGIAESSEPQRRPADQSAGQPSLGAVSLPPWQISTSGSSRAGSTSAPSEDHRSQSSIRPSPFDSTHLADPPSSTEIMSEGRPATPEQDTVVGLKWKTQEKRTTKVNQQHPGQDEAHRTGRDRPAGRPEKRDQDERPNEMQQVSTAVDRIPAGAPRDQEKTPAEGPVASDSRLRAPHHEPVMQRHAGAPKSAGPKSGPGPSTDWLPPQRHTDLRLPMSLEQVRPLEIILSLAGRGEDLGIEIRNDVLGMQASFLLAGGYLCDAKGAPHDLSFAQWLVRMSLVAPDSVWKLDEGASHRTDRLIELLLSRNLLSRQGLEDAYREWLAWLFYEAVSWRSGQVSALPVEAFARPVEIRMDWPELVCEAVRRKYRSDWLSALVGGPQTTRTWASDRAMQVALSACNLTPSEHRALTLLTQGLSLAETARKVDMEDQDLAALVHALDMLGLLTAPDASTTTGAPSGGSPQAQAERIAAKLEQIREADYFSLLGVRPTASLREIRAAYEQVKASFADEFLDKEILELHDSEILLIREVLDEAVAVLTHPRYAALYAEAFLKHHK